MEYASFSERKRSRSPTILLDSQVWDDDCLSQSVLAPHKKPKCESSNKEIKKELKYQEACNNCQIVTENIDKKDKRNILFGQLVAEKLDLIKPCLRTRTYAKILNFLNEAKVYHSHEIKYDTQIE